MVEIGDYDYLEQLNLNIEKIQEQIRFNQTIIKRLNQRNTELKYIITGIEEDIKTFKEEVDL